MPLQTSPRFPPWHYRGGPGPGLSRSPPWAEYGRGLGRQGSRWSPSLQDTSAPAQGRKGRPGSRGAAEAKGQAGQAPGQGGAIPACGPEALSPHRSTLSRSPRAPAQTPGTSPHPPTHTHTPPPTPGTHPRALTPSTPPPPPHPTPPPPRTPGHPPPLPSPPATRGAPIPRQPTRWRSLPPGRRADARDVSRPAPFERLSAAENSDFPCGSQHNYSALLLQWLWLDPWPGNFHMPQVRPLVLRSRSPPRPAPGPFASPFAPARPLPSPASPEPTSRAPRPRPPAPRTPTHTRAPTRPPQPSPTLSHLAMLSLASSHRPTAAATCPKRRHRSAPRRRRRRRRVPHGPVRASCPPRQARSPAGPAAHLCSPPTPHPHIPRGPTGP